MGALGVLLGVMITGGIFLAIRGLLPHVPNPDRPKAPAPQWWVKTRSALYLSTREKQLALVGAAVGLVLTLATGWVIMIAVLPVVLVGLPRLLSTPEAQQNIDRLEALEEWTRALAGVLGGAGSGLTDALVSSLRVSPEPIRPQVENLVARLQARRPAAEALRIFADELDDSTADLIAGTLILGARETGARLSDILTSMAISVADQVRARRDIEAARAGPRSEARLLTIVSVMGLAGFVFFTSFGAYYRSPGGQFILVIVVAAFGTCLWWMKLAASTKPVPRFLPASTGPTGGFK